MPEMPTLGLKHSFAELNSSLGTALTKERRFPQGYALFLEAICFPWIVKEIKRVGNRKVGSLLHLGLL